MVVYRPYRRRLRSILKNRLTIVGVVMILLVSAMAILAPWISPWPPSEIYPSERYQRPNTRHILGTDNMGRDVLSRVLHGTRISLAVGVLSVFLGLVSGVVVGTFAAYKGGKTDVLITEAANMLVAIPTILLGITILSIWGGGFSKLVITLALAYFPRFIRLSRGLTLSLKEKDFIEAARACGRRDSGIIFHHMLPNLISVNIVAGSLWVSSTILAQASLSYLGLGIPPPTATWGGMIRDGVKIITIAPWLSVYPGICIMLTVIGFNMIGDGIRDFLDPRLHGSL